MIIKKHIKPKSVTNYIAIKELEACEAVPKAEANRAVCITHLSFQEETEKFAKSLIRSVKAFTYSQDRLDQIQERLAREENIPADEIDHYITQQCTDLFREISIEGQLGELILYVILEQHFRAIPVIRKMPITTDPNLERNGADAIHLRKVGEGFELIVGEAKTYSKSDIDSPSKSQAPSYRGFYKAINSALNSLKTLWNETEVYLMADFIPPEIRQIVLDIKNKRIDHSVLICVICIFEHEEVLGSSDNHCIDLMHIEADKAIREFIKSKAYKEVPENLKPKFCFISFPVAKMTELKEKFKCQI